MIGRVTDTGRHGAALARARSWPTCRSRRSATRRRSIERPHEPTPPARAGSTRQRRATPRDPHRDGAAAAARLPRPRLQALDLGAVRPHGHGRHRAAARAAMPRWCACTAPTEALALTTDCTPRYCFADPATRRHAGGGRGLAQPRRGRRAAARASPTT